MPIYEYRCDACSHQFDLRQKFSDAPAEQCPKCGGTVRKMVSAAAFSLKGGGWYDDGYGTKAETAKPENDTTTGTEAATKAVPSEAASTEKTTTETATAPAPATPPTPSKPKTKSTAAETPATSKEAKS